MVMWLLILGWGQLDMFYNTVLMYVLYFEGWRQRRIQKRSSWSKTKGSHKRIWEDRKKLLEMLARSQRLSFRCHCHQWHWRCQTSLSPSQVWFHPWNLWCWCQACWWHNLNRWKGHQGCLWPQPRQPSLEVCSFFFNIIATLQLFSPSSLSYHT